MTKLRAMFNAGESVYLTTPSEVSIEKALEDLAYTRFVLENAYSGYLFLDKEVFDGAFDHMRKTLNQRRQTIEVNRLIDLLADNLSFIEDGHLIFATADYGKGFYRKYQTYLTDFKVKKADGKLLDTDSNQEIIPSQDSRLFKTLGPADEEVFLLGIRSTDEVKTLKVQIGSRIKEAAVHKIKSKPQTSDVLMDLKAEDGIACVTSSTFIGDSKEDFEKFHDIGKKAHDYPHVLWDLSNNLGGNSEFPKLFLKGLNNDCFDETRVLDLKSTLVSAKENGKIQAVPFGLEAKENPEPEDRSSYTGTLHVVINDFVASSAELAVIMAKSVEHVVFYGCNTRGVGRFGDLCIYYLPNSKIVLWCPQKVFDHSIAEGRGFEPDFWIDDEAVVDIVKQYIKTVDWTAAKR